MANARFKLDEAHSERPSAFAQPTHDLEQAKADLDRWGYAVIKGGLEPERVAALRAVLEEAIAAEEAADPVRGKGVYALPDERSRYLGELPARHKLFRDLLEHPLPLEMTAHLFGPQFLDESYLVRGASGTIQKSGARAQGLHADQDNVRPYLDAPVQLRALWMLTDFTEEGGATSFVPGSHKWGRRPDTSGATHYETTPVEAPAGSLLVWDNRTYHAAGPNLTDRDRPVLVLSYGPTWARSASNWPLVIDPAVMADASPTLRRLLGYSSVARGFDHPWMGAAPALRDLVVPPK
jgi:ectoine hydroxylase-related dioxygenase (phytanoyl-CoA dioxygenase family)